MTDIEIWIRLEVIDEQIERIFNDLAYDKRIAEMQEAYDLMRRLSLFAQNFRQSEEEYEDDEEVMADD